MYLTNLFLERFAERSNVRVDGLADGLNIVFGPPGSGKTTVVRFLQAIFAGFDPVLRERHVTRGWGGKITLQVDQTAYSISRYDDGGRDGRLTVERPDNAVCERRQVHRLLSDLNHALLRHAVVVDFNRRPELNELLAEIAACGFLPTVDSPLSEQRQVRDGDVVEAEQHLSLLRREIANIEQTLSDLGQRRKLLSAQLESIHGHLPRSHSVPSELRVVELQLRRWKRTLRDLLQNKKLAAEQYASRSLVDLPIAKTTAELHEPLVSYEHLSAHLRSILEHLGTHEIQQQSTSQVRSQVSDAVDQLQQEVRRVIGTVEQQQARQFAREALAQRDQFARTEAELRRAMRWLAWRRTCLLARRVSDVGTHTEHETRNTASGDPMPTKNVLVQEISALNHEIARLAEVRLKWLAEVDEWEIDLAERRSKWNHHSDTWAPIVRDASEFLRRLTGNDELRVHVAGRCEVWLENQAGQRIGYEQLDLSLRDQLYFAFCLAVAMANQRWGRQIPLVLNGVFTHFPSQKVRHALEFLIGFGRGQQIICLTRHEHVVSVARLMNIPVRALYVHESTVPSVPHRELNRTTHSDHVTRVPAAARNRVPLVESTMWTADEISRRFGHLSRRATTNLVDAANTLEGASDEFDLPADIETSKATSGDGTYCLVENDAIERTPSLDAVNAQRLRKIGLLRVGDLLRVPTADVAYDLRHTGVSIDMIESWRAQARLMCIVPGLGTYDARILVACGLRDPEQLIQMQPGALRARVKEFATSAEGQAILMSGTEFELSRVTDWINTARELRRPQSTPTQVVDESTKQRLAERREHRRNVRRSEAHAAESSSQRVSRDKRNRSKANVVQLTYDADAHHCLVQRSDSIDAIPWLGSVSVKRLQKAGITTVGALVDSAADTVVAQLKLSRVRRETVLRWQAQLKLVCAIPNLGFQEARILYVLGITNTELLATSIPADLWQKVSMFCQSPDGRKLLGNRLPPVQDQVSGWINIARQYHSGRAA